MTEHNIVVWFVSVAGWLGVFFYSLLAFSVRAPVLISVDISWEQKHISSKLPSSVNVVSVPQAMSAALSFVLCCSELSSVYP